MPTLINKLHTHMLQSRECREDKMSFCSTIAAMVCGYHEYQGVWQAALGEKLKCVQEGGNRSDMFAVAIVKVGETVEHLPRKISSICLIFLRNGGEIVCKVTGSRRYSRDFPQGGLEVLCMLKFVVSSKDTTKTKKVIDLSMFDRTCTINTAQKSDR